MVILAIVLGALIALVVTILAVRLGLLVRFDNGALYAALTIAGFPIPLSALTGNGDDSTKSLIKAAKKRGKSGSKQFELPPSSQILPIIFDFLDKLRHRAVITDLAVNYSIGGDPQEAALRCGALQAAVGFFMPLAAKVIRIKRSHIQISPNFIIPVSMLYARARVTMSVFSALGLAWGTYSQYNKSIRENTETKGGTKNGEESTGCADGGDDAAHT